MRQQAVFDKIELHLVRVLFILISEGSVTRAAMRLQSTQPSVSAQLRRLRDLTGDPLLVRSGHGMVPTEVARQLLEPAATILRESDALFGARRREFDAANSTLTFRIAASDFLDPLFLPELVGRLKALAPGVGVEIQPLSAQFDYRNSLARGQLDLVVGNWLAPPGELHMARLLTDEIVCLVAADHPAAQKPTSWTEERYFAAEHVAPCALHPGWRSVIDDHVGHLGRERNIAVRSPYFGLAPMMVARSRLVLTTGRLFCSRYAQQLPLRIVPCPVAFPPLPYYQLWHDLTHTSAACRWLREQARDVARGLAEQAVPQLRRVA